MPRIVDPVRKVLGDLNGRFEFAMACIDKRSNIANRRYLFLRLEVRTDGTWRTSWVVRGGAAVASIERVFGDLRPALEYYVNPPLRGEEGWED